METLKQLFPLSFQAEDLSQLILYCLLYLVAGAILIFVLDILARIPIVGLIFTLISSLAGIYITAGLVVLFLVYFKILK